MRILVTGGAGFIGSHVADALIGAGHDVAVVDDLSTGSIDNVPTAATFYRMDIRDERLDGVFQEFKPEVVSHHAAQMSVRVSMQRPRFDASVNVEGSVNLLECARDHGVRKIIYASTGGAIYGEPNYLPCDEQHLVAPLCNYGVSKYTVELYLQLYARLYGLDYTILRYPNVYGPRQDPEGEAGVVAIFIGRMLSGLPVTIFGDGLQSRDFVYVGDVAQATLHALEQGSQTAVNLGSGAGTSVRQIFEHLADITGFAQQPVFEPARLGEVYQIYLTGDRAYEEIGWTPRTDLVHGLRHTVASVDKRRDQVAATA